MSHISGNRNMRSGDFRSRNHSHVASSRTNAKNGARQQTSASRSNYDDIRYHANKNRSSNQQTQYSTTNNNNHRPYGKRHSSAFHSVSDSPPIKRPCLPPVSYHTLTELSDKSSDEILAEMLRPHFQLKIFLNHKRMRERYDWIFSMTKLIETITHCTQSLEHILTIFEQLPKTVYLEGVYDEVRKLDPDTNQLRFKFIELFLKISNTFLAMTPHSADSFTKIFERIELQLTKNTSESPEFEAAKEILNEVLERVKEIEIKEQISNTTKNITIIQNDIGQPPNNYRQLPIIPSIIELLSEQRPYFRKNIIDGVYENAQQYLDIHFRLLREDFIGPLREGIQQYLSKVKGKNFNVRIYENVNSLGSRITPRNGLVYDLRLDRTVMSRISWANSRRLIYGNLLVLTSNNFQSCMFVTVEDRSQIERDFIISVKTLEKFNHYEGTEMNLDKIDSSHSLTMVETMTYFEAYRPVLSALQLMPSGDKFPLAPFILKLTNKLVPPDYITPTTKYDFTPFLVDPNSGVKANVIIHEIVSTHRHKIRKTILGRKFQMNYKQSHQVEEKYKTVSILNEDEWPTSEQLHLNPRQREALILALTNKVALIQGPPGTGKTYLGVRMTEMLLYNRSVWCPSDQQSTPILMICHTNHALDQFLELVIKRLNIREGIIRVGSRCQNPTIQPFSLHNARKHARENRSLPGSIFHQKRKILDEKNEAEQLLKLQQNKMEMSQTKIISLSSFAQRSIIDDRHYRSLLASYNDDMADRALFKWLDLACGFEPIPSDLIYREVLETHVSAMEINDCTEDKQSTDEESTEDEDSEREFNVEEEEQQQQQDELHIKEHENSSQSAVRKNERTTVNPMNTKILSKELDDIHRLIRRIVQSPITLNDETVKQINDDVWQLPLDERVGLYRYWLLKYQQDLHNSFYDESQDYNKAVSDLDEFYKEIDYHILKDSIIVAMTTTCASKYHKILEKLQSKIVIVEEAAAIFEAHIITALSTKCEHLILIGDHIQLRPNPSVYHLGQRYHLDVSLFERFVKNNFPSVRLNIQHRMRPEIARLMKHFYDDLEDHASVKTDRAPVRGVDSNIYFINHSNFETTIDDGRSMRNEFEGNYAIGLAEYLIKQGYQPKQITILVMYLGQKQFIVQKTKQIRRLQGVRTMVTDDYQGEENEIIILSLVRSNSEKKIGFLKTQNRICVALSRARCGLFVIGNMNLLAEVDDMWKKIIASLSETKNIGQGLSLSCRQHSKEKFIADKAECFAQRPEGGCRKPCDVRLKCGHRCELICHNYDLEHKDAVCHKKCNERLSCGHSCKKICHSETPDGHNICFDRVEKTIPECGHKIHTDCCTTPTVNDCKKSSSKKLPCGHAVDVPCRIIFSSNELKRYRCSKPCDKMLACKHRCTGNCADCRTGQLHVPCQQNCDRELICSHVCKEPCATNCPPCLQACETRCIHSRCRKKCRELCIPCKEPCTYRCKHLQCTRLCSEPCNRGPCNEPCKKKLRCGHTCIGICGEPCPWKCRKCDKRIVQEIFFGSEDEPNARFVFLPDCKHIIEVTALDRFVYDFINNSNDKTAIRFPECPRCRRKIHRCQRYTPIINQAHSLISEVKQKILGNKSRQEIYDGRTQLIIEYERIKYNFKEINLDKSNEDFFHVVYDEYYFFTDDMLNLFTNLIVFLNEIDKILFDGRTKLQGNILFEDLVNSPLRYIVKYLFTQRHHRNFAEQQLTDIQSELKRIRRVIYIETLIFSLKQTLKENEKQGIASMQHLTKKSGPFTDQDRQTFDDLFKEFEYLNNLPGLGISEHERLAIVSALNMSKGRWYICPNGHPYVITECGGANQESQCPDCGQGIGGQNHRVLDTNRHFGLMDGSQHPVWSNEANLNLPQPPMW